MRLLFTRRHHVGSHIIRAFTWSAYSHVDLMINDVQVVGAMAFSGVDIELADKRIDAASKALVMHVPAPLEDAAIAFACKQRGKLYDWPGVFGIGVHRDWQHDDKWSCAELVAASLRHGGVKLFEDKFYRRVTPQDLLMLPFEREVIKS